MSLKKFLEHKSSKSFRDLLLPCKDLFRTDDNEQGYEKISILAPPISDSDAQSVGTAYDFYIRAFIQKENDISVEEKLPEQVKSGLKKAMGICNKKEHNDLLKQIEKDWQLRIDYIKNGNVNERELAEALLRLTYMENIYRGGIREVMGKDLMKPSEKDIENLIGIIRITSKQPLFEMNKKEQSYFNPILGHQGNELVRGADADWIKGNMLIDFKTDKEFGYKSKYLYQLLGYYILAKEMELNSEIEKLCLFYGRYNRLVILEIEEYKKYLLKNNVEWDKVFEEFYFCAENYFNLMKGGMLR